MIILPSLEIVPAKYNSGTLLSQIPIDGTGDFTVSRTTSPVTGLSTRVNSLGLIETVNDNVPRLDYPLGGAVNGCPALLTEPSAQNSALQSAGFEVSGTWAPTNTSITTGTTAAFTAPDNSTDADLLTSTTSGSLFVGQTIAIASGTYTISVFAKAGTSHIFSLGNVSRTLRGAWFNLNAGAVTGTVNGGTASMQNYGNGWYRCIYTSSGMVSGTNTLIVGLADAANGLSATSGTNLYAWGAQLETGSVATSYIPTTTAAVTRNADVVSVSGAVSGSIGQTEGTMYCEFEATNDAVTRRLFTLSNGTQLNRMVIYYSASAWRAQIQSTSISLGNFTSGYHKIAFAYQQNGVSGNLFASIDGGAVVSGTSATFPTSLTMVNLGKIEDTGSSSFLNARILAAALYPTRLTDTQLALLTSPYTSYSSMASALSYTLG